jgi:hypothetical protein
MKTTLTRCLYQVLPPEDEFNTLAWRGSFKLLLRARADERPTARSNYKDERTSSLRDAGSLGLKRSG